MTSCIVQFSHRISRFTVADSHRNDSQNDNTSLICVNKNTTALFTEEEEGDSIYKLIFKTKPLLLTNAFVFLTIFTFVNPTIFRKLNAIGSLCNLILIVIVMYFAITWGIHADFSNPEASLYMPMFRPKFFRLTGILSMGLFLHNAVITIVCKTKNQENNVCSAKRSARTFHETPLNLSFREGTLP